MHHHITHNDDHTNQYLHESQQESGSCCLPPSSSPTLLHFFSAFRARRHFSSVSLFFVAAIEAFYDIFSEPFFAAHLLLAGQNKQSDAYTAIHHLTTSSISSISEQNTHAFKDQINVPSRGTQRTNPADFMHANIDFMRGACKSQSAADTSPGNTQENDDQLNKRRTVLAKPTGGRTEEGGSGCCSPPT